MSVCSCRKDGKIQAFLEYICSVSLRLDLREFYKDVIINKENCLILNECCAYVLQLSCAFLIFSLFLLFPFSVGSSLTLFQFACEQLLAKFVFVTVICVTIVLSLHVILVKDQIL